MGCGSSVPSSSVPSSGRRGSTPGLGYDVTIKPGDDIQAAVDGARPGARILFKPGAYSIKGGHGLTLTRGKEVSLFCSSLSRSLSRSPAESGVTCGPGECKQ